MHTTSFHLDPLFTYRVSVRARTVLVGIAFAMISDAGLASDVGKQQSVIQVPYGITNVQLTASGVPGVLIRARRENFNAHGFDVLSVYALPKSDAQSDSGFLIVPVWETDKEQLVLTSREGADCKLAGFRFTGGTGRDLQLVLARRDFGTSYMDAATVTFTYFSLKQNSSGEPGRPPYYFESTTSVKASRSYCDVDEAFRRELSL